jgi:hypothetical protein
MRAIFRSPALIHLLILAIPVIAIGYTLTTGSPPRAASKPFQNASTACLAIGLGVVLLAVGLRSVQRGKPPDERALELRMSATLIGADLIVDSFSFLLAIASPTVGLVICAFAAAWILICSPPRLRRTRTTSSFVVKSRSDVVFAFLSDSRNQPRWSPEVESVEMLTVEPIGRGTQFRARVRQRLRVWEGVEEIVDYEPDRRFTTRITSGSRPNIDEFTFEPFEGATRVTHRFDFEHSFSSWALGGWLRWPALNRLLMKRRQAAELRIKQILEGDS